MTTNEPKVPMTTYWALFQEEYRTVRDEAKQAEINTFTAFQWGATLIGVAAGLTKWQESPATVIVSFGLLIPIFSVVSFYVWIGEAVRMKRAGDYLVMLELKAELLLKRPINSDSLDMPIRTVVEEWTTLQRSTEDALRLVRSERPLVAPLHWERWLRETRPGLLDIKTVSGHQSVTYAARLAFFPVMAVVSWFIARFYMYSHVYYLLVIYRVPIVHFNITLQGAMWCVLVTILLCLGFAFRLVYYQLIKKPSRAPLVV
jgi:hypothetical protein